MTNEEKHLRVIELLQGRLKMIADFATRGILFHLGFSAFSVTIIFQNIPVPLLLVQVMNIINTLAILSTLVIYNDFTEVRNQIVNLHHAIGIKIDPREFQSWLWIELFYSCASLIVFWVSLWFIKIKPAS